MLKRKLLHPEIMSALGRNGHGAKILIADGNYPFSTGAPAHAEKIFVNLMPGIPTVTNVLEALLDAIPVESACVMAHPDDEAVAVHQEFTELLPGIEFKKYKRFDFYEQAKDNSTALVVATGEQRRFANLLLTIGVVK